MILINNKNKGCTRLMTLNSKTYFYEKIVNIKNFFG